MKITNLKQINKGLMISGFDVEVKSWGVTFKKCTLFQSGDKRWISFPALKYQDKSGETKYAPYVYLEKERKQKFDEKVIKMLDAGEYEKAKEYDSITQSPAPSTFDEECPF